MTKSFKLNKLDEDTYQIYGQVSGLAQRKEESQGRRAFHVSVQFFIDKGILVSYRTGPKDNTIISEQGIIDKINRWIKQEEENEI